MTVLSSFPISPSWLISSHARRIYSIAALAAVAYFGIRITIEVAVLFAGGSLADLPALRLFLYILMFPGIVGISLVWVAMWFFWGRYHPADSIGKGAWLLVLLLMGPFGSLLYLAFVYRRSPLFKANTTVQSTTA